MFSPTSPTPTILTSPIRSLSQAPTPLKYLYPQSLSITSPKYSHLNFCPWPPTPTPTVLTIIMQNPQYLSQRPKLPGRCPPPPIYIPDVSPQTPTQNQPSQNTNIPNLCPQPHNINIPDICPQTPTRSSAPLDIQIPSLCLRPPTP